MTLAPERSTTATTNGATPKTDARLPVIRFFTKPETDPYDEIAWEIRSAVIDGADGKPVFEQHNCELPASWSQNATNVVASKYFRGAAEADERARARAVRQAAHRPRGQLHHGMGLEGLYFADEDERETFRQELKYAAREPDALLQLAGLVQRRRRGRTRSAAPASSSASKTRSTRSSTGTAPRARSSRVALAPASTSRPSAAPPST